jgi:hypothetical protein
MPQPARDEGNIALRHDASIGEVRNTLAYKITMQVKDTIHAARMTTGLPLSSIACRRR